jgi:hypothetical protein
MQPHDATEPLNVQELRQSLDHWAAISSQMIHLLHETAGYQRSRNWRPHLAQIVNAIRAFGDRCRSESQEFGSWRADHLAPDDVFERAREQGQRLVDWLQRMIPE